MAIVILNTILIIVAIYLACGFVFAIPFVIKGANVIDEGTHGATWGFRIIILPASIVFWPLLLKKWIAANKNKNND
ncbi:MAG: hypothetical protein ABI594_20445 [Ginsengibacter sp.]